MRGKIPVDLRKSVSHPHLTRRGNGNTRKQCGPVALQARDRQKQLIVFRAKPALCVESSLITHRQGDSFTAKAEGSSQPVPTGEPIWEIKSSLK